MRIMVVDDDSDLRDVLSYILRRKGHNVVTAPDGEVALAMVRESPPDLVVLDISMPKLDGLETCKRLRESYGIPIIMLTVQGGEADIVRSLELGADDHLSKPFNHQELVARVEALLRRAYGPGRQGLMPGQPIMESGGIRIDPGRHEVYQDGTALNITPLEFKLLYYLMRNESQVLSAGVIMENVWGYDNDSDDEVVKVNVSRLRHKLEGEPGRPRLIHTVPGVGYSFRPPQT